jgi:hypothetical protein
MAQSAMTLDNNHAKAFRKPKRITITVPHSTYLDLERLSCEQGRSLSNLSAHLLECAMSMPIKIQPMQTLTPSSASKNGHLASS